MVFFLQLVYNTFIQKRKFEAGSATHNH